MEYALRLSQGPATIISEKLGFYDRRRCLPGTPAEFQSTKYQRYLSEPPCPRSLTRIHISSLAAE